MWVLLLFTICSFPFIAISYIGSNRLSPRHRLTVIPHHCSTQLSARYTRASMCICVCVCAHNNRANKSVLSMLLWSAFLPTGGEVDAVWVVCEGEWMTLAESVKERGRNRFQGEVREKPSSSPWLIVRVSALDYWCRTPHRLMGAVTEPAGHLQGYLVWLGHWFKKALLIII